MNRFLSVKKKFVAEKFPFVNNSTKLLIEHADTPRTEGWSSDFEALISVGSLLTMLGATTQSVPRVMKHKDNPAGN